MHFDMNTLSKSLLSAALGACAFGIVHAAEEPSGFSASELASKLSGIQQDGNSYVRYKLDTAGGTLQIEGKQRKGKGGTEAVYRVLFPKDRKGEAILIKPGGGTHFIPPDKLQPIPPGKLDDPFFGSALANADLVENFFAWPQQTLVGTETVDRVSCQVLESKPGKGGSIYGSVKSWIDMRRMVPLRVEKYSGSGQLVRRIDTTRVVADDLHRQIPANLSIKGPGGASSDLDGSKIKHGVKFGDAEFTTEGLKQGGAE